MSHNNLPPQIFVVPTEPLNETHLQGYKRHIKLVNNFLGYNLAKLLPLEDPDNHEDYGYTLTDLAIDHLTARNKELQCRYILFTNGDNFYRANFLDFYINDNMAEGFDLIGFSFISHHPNWQQSRTEDNGRVVSDDATNHAMDVDFKANAIDLGACIIKFSFFEENPSLRFVKITEEKGARVYIADGVLIEDVASKTNSTIIHRQILFVHQ